MLKKILLSAIILASSGCGTNFIRPRIALPAPLTYPKISPEELKCLSNDANLKLSIVIKKFKARIKTLRKQIKDTHK